MQGISKHFSQETDVKIEPFRKEPLQALLMIVKDPLLVKPTG